MVWLCLIERVCVPYGVFPSRSFSLVADQHRLSTQMCAAAKSNHLWKCICKQEHLKKIAMQPLPFSEAELLNLFISLVLVCLRFVGRFAQHTATQFRIAYHQVLFVVQKCSVLSLILIVVGLSMSMYFYRSKQAIKRRTFVFPFAFLHMCVLFPLVLPRFAYCVMRWSFHVSALVDEMKWPQTLVCVYSQWFNPCEPIRATT